MKFSIHVMSVFFLLNFLFGNPAHALSKSKLFGACHKTFSSFNKSKITLKVDTKDPNVNAYATPKGNIILSQGLLKDIRNIHEAALICGHEAAHVQLGHYKSAVKGLIAGMVAAIEKPMIGELLQKNRRKNEIQADKKGLKAAWQAGFNPRIAIKFWKRHLMHIPANKNLSSNHPTTIERLQVLERFIQENF